MTIIRRKAEKICRTKLFGKTCGDEVKERVAILKIFLRTYNQPKSCSNVEIINFHSANKTFFAVVQTLDFGTIDRQKGEYLPNNFLAYIRENRSKVLT